MERLFLSTPETTRAGEHQGEISCPSFTMLLGNGQDISSNTYHHSMLSQHTANTFCHLPLLSNWGLPRLIDENRVSIRHIDFKPLLQDPMGSNIGILIAINHQQSEQRNTKLPGPVQLSPRDDAASFHWWQGTSRRWRRYSAPRTWC